MPRQSTTTTTKTQDTDHTSIIGAVATTNVTDSSTTALPSFPEQMGAGSDSGYASQSSMQDNFVASTGRNILPHAFRRPKQLKPFNKPIPQLTRDRFSDLRELYADSLNKFTLSLPNCQGMLMSLMVLGEDEETARPWVFVQCDKAIYKNVNKFFRQSFIEIEFEPPEPTDRSPRLQVLVHPLKPTQLTGRMFTCLQPLGPFAKDTHASLQQSPLAPNDSFPIFYNRGNIFPCRYHSIQVMSGISGLPTATMGGFIMVTCKTGEKHIFGITAAHFLLPQSYEESQEEINDDLEGDFSTEEESFELDFCPIGEEEKIPPPGGVKDKGDDKASLGRLVQIGYISVVYTSLPDERKDESNLDWALMTIEKLYNSYPESFLFNQRISEFRKCDFNGPLKFVAMLSTRGFVRGTISSSWSYMMLPPGRILVQTYLLTLLDHKRFSSGDSGAWVIDLGTEVLYGHVVASDVFGRGYVVPISDTFEDIKNRLSAESVSLPSKDDIIAFYKRLKGN